MHQSITHVSPIEHTSLPVIDPVPALQKMYHLQETLRDLNNTLQHRNTEIDNLKQQLRDARSSPHQPLNNSSTVPLMFYHYHHPIHIHRHLFQHVLLLNHNQLNHQLMHLHLWHLFLLLNSLPKFSGKDGEIPTKFITEFEFSATSIFGSNDEYLLRTIQQCLFDTALTWYIQVKQEQFIDRWAQFKTLFIRRFRTPGKIEHLRGQLHSLWQADNESTTDYYERLKSLISEIDPQTSLDYIKRKFLQKLRKDIRNKLRLSQSSFLSDLLQDAIETEYNIIQQKFDDKLRATHNTNVSSSTTVNHLHGTSEFFPSSSTNNNEQVKSDNRNYSILNRRT